MKSPPPPGSFDYLLAPPIDQRAPAVPPPPPPERGGGGPRIRVEIEITDRRAPPRPAPAATLGSLLLLAFWGLILWALLGCAHARAQARHDQRAGEWCTSYRVGFTTYTDCTSIPGSASPAIPGTHCQSYRSGFSRQTVCTN